MIGKDGILMIVYLSLGLIMGVYFDWLIVYKPNYYVIELIFPLSLLFFALSFNGKHGLKLLLSSFLVSFLLCTPFFSMNHNVILPQDTINSISSRTIEQGMYLISFIMGFAFALYISHAFHYAIYRDQRITPSYRQLFLAVWNTIPVILIACVFSCLANGLIYLTSLIFWSMGINAPWLFLTSNSHFIVVSNSVLFFMGLGVARQNEDIINSFRQVLLRIIYYLLPYLAVITILYIILYLFYGKRDSLMIPTLIGLGIIFYNAYFQEGNNSKLYSKSIESIIKIFQIVLAILAFIFVYNIVFFLESYLFVNAALYLVIVVTYCLSYAIAAMLPKHVEVRMVQSSNVMIALLFLFAFLIANNPFKPFGGYKLHLPGAVHKKSTNVINPQDRKIRQDYIVISPTPPTRVPYPSLQQKSEFKKQYEKQMHYMQLGGLSWRATSNNNLPHVDHKDVNSVCRVIFHQGLDDFEIGRRKNHQCVVTYGGMVYHFDDFTILKGTLIRTTWQKERGQGIPLGLEFRPDMVTLFHNTNLDQNSSSRLLRPLSACRVKVNQAWYVGKIVDDRCNIAYSNQERSYSIYETLVFDQKTKQLIQPKLLQHEINRLGLRWSDDIKDPVFVAAIGQQGKVGICQVDYQRGKQIGSYQENQCTITYGGKALSFDKFKFLSTQKANQLAWRQQPIWQQKSIQTTSEESLFIALGYEFIDQGTAIRTLYACRTIVDNEIKVGKIVNEFCLVASNDKEIQIPIKLATVLSEE